MTMMFKLRRSVDGKTFVLKNVEKDISFSEFQQLIQNNTGISRASQMLMSGHPPSSLTSISQLVSGSVIVVSSKPDMRMIRKVIDADNSCLFNAIAYCLGKDRTGNGPELRDVIKQAIISRPDTFTSVFLGKPVDEYCDWIMQPSSWGGEIELSILSLYFKVEIMVFQIQTMTSYCYGRDSNHNNYRIFLMYDGIHYDAIAQVNVATKVEKSQFELGKIDELNTVSSQAMELIQAANQASQFTDVHNFTISCLVCGTGLSGQAEAQRHAQATGHQNFGQV